MKVKCEDCFNIASKECKCCVNKNQDIGNADINYHLVDNYIRYYTNHYLEPLDYEPIAYS